MIIINSNRATKFHFLLPYVCCLIFFLTLSSCTYLSQGLNPNHIDLADNNYNNAEKYFKKRQYKDAIKKYNASLKFNKKYRPKIAVRDLNKIGDCYKELRNFQKSEKAYLDALKIDKQYYDSSHPNISRDYYLLAELCFIFGKYSQCKQYIEKSLKIDRSRSSNNYSDIIRDLNILALLYDNLGQYDKALKAYKELISLIKEVYGEKNANMAKAYNNIAIAYYNKNNYDEAKRYSLQALKIDKYIEESNKNDIDDKHIYVARDLNNLGILYKNINNYTEAKSNYHRSLQIYEKNYGNDHPVVAAILCNIGLIYSNEKNFAEALDYLLRALIIAEANKEPELLWRVLNALREFYVIQNKPNESIFFGKRAVKIIQSQRLLISDLDNTLQNTFMTNKKNVYRGLARTLFQQGRYLEGFQIWQMLKDEEFFEFIEDSNLRGGKRTGYNIKNRRGSLLNRNKEKKIDDIKQEQQYAEGYNEVIDNIILLNKEYRQLCKNITINKKQRCQIINNDLKNTKKYFHHFLKSKKITLKNTLNSKKIKILYESRLKKISSFNSEYKPVIVIYLLHEKKIDILLLTPNIPIYCSKNLSSIDFSELIQKYIEKIKDYKSNEHLEVAKKLYSYIIKPIEKYINQYNANMIMFSLDGPLHNIPLSALYDGQRYVADKYCLSVYYPDIDYNIDVNKKNISLRASVFGVSKEIPPYKKLPSVKTELQGIRHYIKIAPSSFYLDEKFTKDNFINELNKKNNKELTKYKKNEIFHIASHFFLEEDSFLLLGDGNKLNIDDIEYNGHEYDFNDVELLTLSACNTGFTTKGSFENFGKLTLTLGCESTLATLWQVEDKSTALFMQYFYKLLTKDTPFYKSTAKAKALQEAQKYFITGKKNNFGISIPNEHYKHPYYWAPFILMGNWL